MIKCLIDWLKVFCSFSRNFHSWLLCRYSKIVKCLLFGETTMLRMQCVFFSQKILLVNMYLKFNEFNPWFKKKMYAGTFSLTLLKALLYSQNFTYFYGMHTLIHNNKYIHGQWIVINVLWEIQKKNSWIHPRTFIN